MCISEERESGGLKFVRNDKKLVARQISNATPRAGYVLYRALVFQMDRKRYVIALAKYLQSSLRPEVHQEIIIWLHYYYGAILLCTM